MVHDIRRAIKELGETLNDEDIASESSSLSSSDSVGNGKTSITGNSKSSVEFSHLEKTLRRRAILKIGKQKKQVPNEGIVSYDLSQKTKTETDEACPSEEGNSRAPQKRSVARRRSSKNRYANKVLGRLYHRRAYTAGLVFGRGHFLGDVSKMMTVSLGGGSSGLDEYGFGDKNDGLKGDYINESIPESEGDRLFLHTSTLAAGKDGCVVIVFPKASLITFLDEYPGILLSLLGTQVVV